MSTVLHPGQKLKRTIKVYGVEMPVILTITHDGLELKVKGSKIGVHQNWPDVLDNCRTPVNVPSKFEGCPREFLQGVAAKMTARLIKRIDKEAKEKQQ